MKMQNNKALKNVQNRGNVPKSLKSKEDGYPVSTWIIALILFVVCGSAIFEIIQHIRFSW